MGIGRRRNRGGSCCKCCNPGETLTGTLHFPAGHAAEQLDGQTVEFTRHCNTGIASVFPPGSEATHDWLECCVWYGTIPTCNDCEAWVVIYCARIVIDPEFPDVTEIRWVLEFDCQERCGGARFTGDQIVVFTEEFDCHTPGTPGTASLEVTGGTGRTFFWSSFDLTDFDPEWCGCDGGCCDDPELPETIYVRWYLPGCVLDGTGATLTKTCCGGLPTCFLNFSTPPEAGDCNQCFWVGRQLLDGLCEDAEALDYVLWCVDGTIYVWILCVLDLEDFTGCDFWPQKVLSTAEFTCDPFAFYIDGGEDAGPGCCGEDCGGGLCVTPTGDPCDPGISTDCCDDNIPTTLSALVETDCPALTGFTVTLNHLSGSEWEGTTTGLCDGSAYSFRLRISCTGSWAGEADLAADLGSAFSCFSDLLLSQTSETCEPLEVVLEADVTIDPFNPDCSCCGGVISTITVTITE